MVVFGGLVGGGRGKWREMVLGCSLWEDVVGEVVVGEENVDGEWAGGGVGEGVCL